MKNELDEQLRRFIDDELDGAEARRVLHAAADDPEARRLLRFEYQLRSHFRADEREEAVVPDGFTDRVMEQIAAETVPASDTRPWYQRAWQSAAQLVEPLMRPRGMVWRPAYGLALILLLIGGGFLGGRMTADGNGSAVETRAGDRLAAAPSDVRAVSEGRTMLTRFLYVDSEASSVAVAGDFTDWEPVPLEPRTVNGRVIWSGMVPVTSGEHRYMFIVDGEEWVTDPLAPVQRDDGFGNRNAILAL